MTNLPKVQKVALIGASEDPGKYSNKAFHLLREHGHEVFPVHPKIEKIEGVRVYRSIEEIPGSVDTVSLYVSKEISSKISQAIINKAPKRIIFNPQAENTQLLEAASRAGIQTIEGCTLVMLKTAQF